MKHKWLLALAALVCALAFAFAGCSDPEGQQGQNEPATPPAAGGHANVLVACFSCTGNTEGVAELIAEKTGGTLFEIVPEVPYTDADLNYNNSDSRANREQNDENARPAIANEVEDMASYVGDLIEAGASYIGACCGSTPNHIRAIAEAAKAHGPSSRTEVEPFTAFTSRTQVVRVGHKEAPIIIGERINPTGRKVLAKDSIDWNLVTDSAGQAVMLFDLYNVNALPRCFLIDEEKKIILKTDNGIEVKQTLEKLIE